MARQLLFVACLLSLPALGGLSARAELPLRAYYKDDFVLETKGGAFQLKVRGNIHFDLRGFQAEEDSGSPFAFDIRRARIDLQGTIHRLFTFRVQPELAGKPYIRNAWVDFGPRPWLHVRAGQLKVPFSTSWSTLDNNVNFVERGSSTPVYPFFDRGVVLWGELWGGAVVYNLGAFTGAGIDVDYSGGDIDDSKDLAVRLFLQPLRHLRLEALRGLYLVGQMTWGEMSVPTTRYETGGLRSPNFETAIWRWRTEQTLGTDGRVSDLVTAEIASRTRWGVELHYLLGPLTLSAELLECIYDDISLYHDLMEGSTRKVRRELMTATGRVRSFSLFASYYFTGEQKRITNAGWKTPKPRASVGRGGIGAVELLARYSLTMTSENLFFSRSVSGYDGRSPELPSGYKATTPGASNTLKVSVIDGASLVHEWTLGLCWTINPMVRLQLNDVLLLAPDDDRDGDGKSDNLLVTGAKSDRSDSSRKNTKVSWENAVMLRVIFKL